MGSLREQALIAWDYDIDLAVAYHGDNFDDIWKSTKRQLHKLGYVCTRHAAQKYRVAPNNPATWNPYKELYQETQERSQGLSRPMLLKKVASRWWQGARARKPHGANCVDIETYRVNPKKQLKLLGSAPIHTKLDDIFPTSIGLFGPLQFAIPRTASMLFSGIWTALPATPYGEDAETSRCHLDPST